METPMLYLSHCILEADNLFPRPTSGEFFPSQPPAVFLRQMREPTFSVPDPGLSLALEHGPVSHSEEPHT